MSWNEIVELGRGFLILGIFGGILVAALLVVKAINQTTQR